MNYFLENLAQRLLSKEAELPQQAVVLPNRRAIIYLKHILAKHIDRPIFLPRFFTMGDMAQAIAGVRPADPVTVGMELYNTYRDLYEDAEDFEVFDNWSSAILRDFNTIDTYLIDVEKLYRDLTLLKGINEWSYLNDELGADQENFNHFWKRLGPLYKEFNEKLQAQGMCYSGGLLRQAASQVNESPSTVLKEIKKFHVAGFNALSPTEITILDGLHESNRLEVCWDDAPFFTENLDDPAGHFLRNWKDKEWNRHC